MLREMHAIVAGCGRVGTELALTLTGDGHTVTVIDKNPRAFHRLGEDFKGETLVGFGFDLDVLRKAGIDHAGALAAVTSGDNSNILVARVARENFGVDRVVARIQDPARAEIYERLGVSTIASVRWATDQIARRMVPDDDRHEWVDPSGKVRLVELPLPAGWAGRRLDDIDEPGRWVVGAVTRLGAAAVVSPDLIGQSGDLIHILVADDAMDDLRTRLDDSGHSGSSGHSDQKDSH